MAVWILIVMINFGSPERVVMQEFGSKEACERASQIIKRNVHRADVVCVRKTI